MIHNDFFRRGIRLVSRRIDSVLRAVSKSKHCDSYLALPASVGLGCVDDPVAGDLRSVRSTADDSEASGKRYFLNFFHPQSPIPTRKKV